MSLKIKHNGYRKQDINVLEKFMEEVERTHQIPLDKSLKQKLTKGSLTFEGTDPPADPRELFEHVCSITLFGVKEVEIGKGVCWTDRWYDTSQWPWHWKCRDCCKTAWARFSHPNLDEVWNTTQQCAKDSATLAIITGIITGQPEAVLPEFLVLFKACMVMKGIKWVDEISVSLFSGPQECGSAHDC